jgi:ribosomal protein S18 acetylase RimI-like enzyme
MDFSLSDEIISQIIFAMENQQHRFYADRRTGLLVQAEDLAALPAEEADLYVEIPDWKPADGFRLMERFMAQLRNPVFRERLKAALAAGSGVFRSFKNTLKQNSEIEKLWYQFKEKGMRRVVRRWYNQQREAEGLELLGPEPEDMEDLLLSDFIIREGGAEDLPALLALDRLVFAASLPDIPAERAEELYRRRRKDSDPLKPGGVLLAAETPGGELAGFAWAEAAEDCAGRETMAVVQLAVAGLFRGLGLGKLLAERLLEESRRRGRPRIQVVLCGKGLEALSLFSALGFQAREQTLEYNGG